VGPDAGVSLVIPALNEEGSLPRVLEAIPGGTIDEVIVVDGGSTDGTAAVARAHGCRVIEEPRRGYGRACATGAAAARGAVLLFMDADGADDPAYLPSLLAPVQSREADLVLGSRLAGHGAGGAMPWPQRAGNRVSAWLIRRLYRLPLTDLSPMRAVRREALASLGLEQMTFGWTTEMIVKAARRGWRVVEVPVTYRERLAGRSKISGTLKGAVLATVQILGIIVRHARP
jgi:glycosyltransferase involved in cell wall biosynthesis